jgi:hypothetical protein
MSWMSGPMHPPVKSNSTKPLGSDEIAEPEPETDDEQPTEEPS